MNSISALLIKALVLIVVGLVTSLPLYYCVKLLEGYVSFFKAVILNMLGGLLVLVAEYLMPKIGSIIAIVCILSLYKIAFDLPWWKTIIVWVMQGLVLVALVFFLALLGMGSVDPLTNTAVPTGAHVFVGML